MERLERQEMEQPEKDSYIPPVSFRDLIDGAEESEGVKPEAEEQDSEAVSKGERADLESDVESEVEAEDDTEEDEEELDEEDDEDSEEDDEEDGDDAEEEAKESDEGPKKKIRIIGKDGKEEKLDPNTVVKVKVDGKYTDVSIHDLTSQWGGKVVIERELSKAKEKSKEVEVKEAKVFQQAEQLKKVEQTLGHLLKPQAGSTWKNIVSLVEAAGYSPVEFEQALIEDVVPQWAQLADMGEHERRNYFLEAEREYNRKRQEALSRKQQQTQTSQQAEAQRLKELQTQSGVTDSELQSAQAWLKSPEGQEALNQSGAKVTPELVVNLVVDTKTTHRAREALKSIDPEVEKKLGGDYTKNLERAKRFILADPSIDDDELNEALSDFIRPKLKKAEVSKNKKKLARKTKKAKSPSPKKADDDEIFTFDDLRKSMA